MSKWAMVWHVVYILICFNNLLYVYFYLVLSSCDFFTGIKYMTCLLRTFLIIVVHIWQLGNSKWKALCLIKIFRSEIYADFQVPDRFYCQVFIIVLCWAAVTFISVVECFSSFAYTPAFGNFKFFVELNDSSFAIFAVLLQTSLRRLACMLDHAVEALTQYIFDCKMEVSCGVKFPYPKISAKNIRKQRSHYILLMNNIKKLETAFIDIRNHAHWGVLFVLLYFFLMLIVIPFSIASGVYESCYLFYTVYSFFIIWMFLDAGDILKDQVV